MKKPKYDAMSSFMDRNDKWITYRFFRKEDNECVGGARLTLNPCGEVCGTTVFRFHPLDTDKLNPEVFDALSRLLQNPVLELTCHSWLDEQIDEPAYFLEC